MSTSASTKRVVASVNTPAKRPILLFDIMDTIVTDPFYTHMAPFLNLTFQEVRVFFVFFSTAIVKKCPHFASSVG